MLIVWHGLLAGAGADYLGGEGMKKSLGSRIDWSNLVQGEVYRVKIPALGEVLARLVDKGKLVFEITDGYLQSQADKKKRWGAGMCFEAIPGLAEFWEIQ